MSRALPFPWHVVRTSGLYVLDFLFPRRCFGCGKIGTYFCDRCVRDIRYIGVHESMCPVCERPAIAGLTHPRCQTRYAVDGLISFFHYDGIIRKAIKALKYRYASDIAQELVALIPNQMIFDLRKRLGVRSDTTLLIPIPLYPSRLRFRGFNQAETLGSLIAQRLGMTVRTDIMARIRKTVPQVDMEDKKQRLKNMDHVFAVHKKTIQQYNNRAIVLFDDVFTTGATMRSAAATLKRSGITSVWGVTLAR